MCAPVCEGLHGPGAVQCLANNTAPWGYSYQGQVSVLYHALSQTQGMLGEAHESICSCACTKETKLLSHKTNITEPADRAFNTSPLLNSAERATASPSTPDVNRVKTFVSLNVTASVHIWEFDFLPCNLSWGLI